MTLFIYYFAGKTKLSKFWFFFLLLNFSFWINFISFSHKLVLYSPRTLKIIISLSLWARTVRHGRSLRSQPFWRRRRSQSFLRKSFFNSESSSLPVFVRNRNSNRLFLRLVNFGWASTVVDFVSSLINCVCLDYTFLFFFSLFEFDRVMCLRELKWIILNSLAYIAWISGVNSSFTLTTIQVFWKIRYGLALWTEE